MRIRDAYTTWATSYDTDYNRTRDLDAVVMQQTFAGQHYATTLELGCGTGKNTALLADISDQVIALDFSEGMLAQARAKITHSNVTFAVADLTQPLAYGDGVAQLATCNLVLEHIEALTLIFIFMEVARVLTTGGQFYVSELHPFKQYQGRKATFQHEQVQVDIAAFVHHLSDFTQAAATAGLRLNTLREWWHDTDEALQPRLVTFLFEK